MLINKRESAVLKHLSGLKAFIEYSNDISDIYKNIEVYNPNRKRKMLMYLMYLMIWLLICLVIKKLNPTVTELFFRGGKLNVSFAFMTQSYFAVPKIIRLNSTHCFVMKNSKKRELQQIAFNH